MNIDDAKAIPMTEILSRLDIHPKRISGTKALYSSPLRHEQTPSFWVYLDSNSWYDYGEAIGGDLVNFVCEYLRVCRQDHNVADALRWINNMGVGPYRIAAFPDERKEYAHDPALILKSQKPVQHLGLISYLNKRGIALEAARRSLREMHVLNKTTGKRFFALGFANEEGGFELRNPFFKGCLRPKAISFIRGTDPDKKSIHLFEGCMDYLSAVSQTKAQALSGDAIVLNSVACLKQALPYIHNYGYRLAYTWMDNDRAGEQATALLSEFFKTQEGLMHQPMNALYAPYKDVNEWHMHRLNLSL
ncbi:MAG: toprim domain-containing protein [Spirosomataceae bacterium]